MSDTTSSWTLAIDYGTTFTTGAILAGDRHELVDVEDSPRVPSVVFVGDSGELVVGPAAERQLAIAPERAERTPKRRIGDEVVLLGDRAVRPVEAIAAVLRLVADEATRRRGGERPATVTLTHPARWGGTRLRALREAARLAGLRRVQLVPEPVAAALHFADERISTGDHVAVYDLGGGTFDTAVLRRTETGFEVVGFPGGDDRLGGEDFDERLYHHLGERLGADDPDAWAALRTSSERVWRKANHDLRLAARQTKEALSANPDYTAYIGAPIDRDLHITREEFETIVRPDLETTVDELVTTVERAGLTLPQLSSVYLVGGSSRIPLVTRLVAEQLGRVPDTWGDPKSVVALGALRAPRLASADASDGSGPGKGSSGPLPKRIGPYEVLRELGRGGMGVVYLAQQKSLGRQVAVKTLPAFGHGHAERLKREAKVLGELQHPHLATVLDVGTEEGGLTYIVMPFFPGGSLAHVLDREEVLSPGQAAGVLAALAEALDATHRKGFLHRDVKPSNVLLSADGAPYLADFGLALDVDASRLSSAHSVLGTAGYTAPEVIADEDPTPASDVYALGICGYQLLAGQLPYEGRNLLTIVDQARRGDAVPLEQLAPDAPAELVELITAAMAVDPDQRPSDLREFAARLRASAPLEPIAPAPPAAWMAPVPPRTITRLAPLASRPPARTAPVPPRPPSRIAPLPPQPPARELPEYRPVADKPPVEPPVRRRRALVLGVAASIILLLALGGLALTDIPGPSDWLVTLTGAGQAEVEPEGAGDVDGGPSPAEAAPSEGAGPEPAEEPAPATPPDTQPDAPPQQPDAPEARGNNDSGNSANQPAAPPPPPPPPPAPPPPEPTVRFSGPTDVNACESYSWTVTVEHATSGVWRSSFGWEEPATHSTIYHIFSDSAYSRTEWFEYEAIGPGGRTKERYNVTVRRDERVTYVRTREECELIAS